MQAGKEAGGGGGGTAGGLDATKGAGGTPSKRRRCPCLPESGAGEASGGAGRRRWESWTAVGYVAGKIERRSVTVAGKIGRGRRECARESGHPKNRTGRRCGIARAIPVPYKPPRTTRSRRPPHSPRPSPSPRAAMPGRRSPELSSAERPRDSAAECARPSRAGPACAPR